MTKSVGSVKKNLSNTHRIIRFSYGKLFTLEGSYRSKSCYCAVRVRAAENRRVIAETPLPVAKALLAGKRQNLQLSRLLRHRAAQKKGRRFAVRGEGNHDQELAKRAGPQGGGIWSEF